MNLLLIDNSNTRTKFRFANQDGLLDWHEWLSTDTIDREKIYALTQELTFSHVVFCSVVPRVAKMLHQAFADKNVHQLSHKSKMNIGIDYPNPQQIGADRLANAMGVVAHYQVPAVVIDFGTAVTFDVISQQKMYCGGVIAPGLGAMNDYLHRKTALLPMIELAEPKHAVAKSTEEAMRAGAVYGYRGLIKEILQQIKKELQQELYVIATGGDAKLISQSVREISLVDSQITMKGLHAAALLQYR